MVVIEIIKKLIKENEKSHKKKVEDAALGERYYRNKNDILHTYKEINENSIRKADNRIPRNFHSLLVNQKAAYLFTYPVLFDAGNKDKNEKITEILGDSFSKVCKDLCIKASNQATAWLHYWIDEENQFQYALVETAQIIPVYSSCLKKTLLAVMRTYKDMDEKTGKEIIIWEYWDKEKCYVFKRMTSSLYRGDLECHNIYEICGQEDNTAEKTNQYEHGFSTIPFISFHNNNIETNDLVNIKHLIDAYDKVFSGFLDDLEDIQEIILIIENYGGEDEETFLKELKELKLIKVDSEDGGKGGVNALTIDIPIEARKEFLDLTRKAIFEQGQGVDPDYQKFGNTSGESLKYLYSLLELKAGLMETEFKLSFSELVRAICFYLKIDCKKIIQTWTRNCIKSDSELSEICSKSVGLISDKTIMKNHPLVEDAESEEKQMQKEKEEKQNSSKFSRYETFQNIKVDATSKGDEDATKEQQVLGRKI